MSVSGVGWSARVVSLPLGVGRGVSAVTKIIKKKNTSTSARFYLSLSIRLGTLQAVTGMTRTPVGMSLCQTP